MVLHARAGSRKLSGPNSAKTQKEKLAQRMFFFWYKPEERRAIESELRRIGRADLIDKLYDRISLIITIKKVQNSIS